MKTRPMSGELATSSSFPLRTSVKNQMMPASRSGGASSGRACRPPRRHHRDPDLLDEDAINLPLIQGAAPRALSLGSTCQPQPQFPDTIKLSARNPRAGTAFLTVFTWERIPMSMARNAEQDGRADAARFAALLGAMATPTTVGLFGSVALLPL